MLMLRSTAALPLPSCALLYGALYCAMLKSQCLSLSLYPGLDSRALLPCLTVVLQSNLIINCRVCPVYIDIIMHYIIIYSISFI